MTRIWPNVYKRSARNDYVIDCGKMGGTKRIVYVRTTLEEAEAKAAECRALRKKLGNGAKSLSTDQLLDSVAAVTLLQGRCSLKDAAQAWVEAQSRLSTGKTVLEAFNALSRDCEMRESRGEMRQHSVSTLVNTLNRFVAKYGASPMSAITKDDLEAYANVYTNSTTRANVIRYIKQLWNYAQHNDWITANVADKVKAPKHEYREPGFCTAEQTEAIFAEMTKSDPAIVPTAALGFFAGLRPFELDRIEQYDIQGAARIIAIRPSVSKVKRPRQVQITDQLAALLLTPITVQGSAFTERFSAVCKRIGMTRFPYDGMRHSAASHMLALTGDPAKTAHFLGHTGTGWRILMDHYANLGVTKADAELYFSIGLNRDASQVVA